MKNIRIGNDINVAWSLYRDDAPFPLEGENISLHLQTPYGRIDLEDFSVEGNVISWIFRGKNQKVLGKYSLILFINKGEDGMVATDACDFVNLVDCSCKVGRDDGCGVETEYVNLTSKVDVGGGSSYDDTELRNEIARVDADLTELSTEVSGLSEDVANKQDEIADLETIRSGASKGATAIQEVKTINGQSIVGSGNITIEGGGGSADLSAIAKWGVKTQDLTREGSADTGYRNVVSNQQYGWIPRQFIDQVSDQYAVEFNAETGYFEYADIKNLAYDEVVHSVSLSNGYLVGTDAYNLSYPIHFFINAYERGQVYDRKFRVLLIPRAYVRGAKVKLTFPSRWAVIVSERALHLEIANFTDLFPVAQTNFKFYMCQALRSAGNYHLSQVNSDEFKFTYCYSLEEVYLKALGFNLDIKYSPLLKNECILFMIQNASKTGITITLHPTAYDRAMADAEIVAAMESKQVNLAKA